MKLLLKKDNGVEIVQDDFGYLVRKKFLFWHIYAVYDFSGMFGWWFNKEHFLSYTDALIVAENFGIR